MNGLLLIEYEFVRDAAERLTAAGEVTEFFCAEEIVEPGVDALLGLVQHAIFGEERVNPDVVAIVSSSSSKGK